MGKYGMNPPQLSSVLLGISLLANIPAYADSWVVTQTVNVTNAITMNQTSTSDSKQAMNAVNLGNNTLENSSQEVTTGNGVTLNQTGDSIQNSKQAMNMILSTGTVRNTTQTVNMSSKDLTLKQSGSNNHQAANMINATTIEGSSSQTVNGINNLTLETSGSGNIQAVNMASATSMGGLSQSVSRSGTATFTLNSCTGCIQAMNYINTDNITGNMNQSFNGGDIILTGNTGTNTGSVQAGNAFIKKSGSGFTGTVTQNWNTEQATVTASTSPTSASSSVIQAANYFAIRSN